MPPKELRVPDKCGRQVWETSGRQVKELMRPKESRVGDKRGRQVEDKCKLMRPKEPRVGDKTLVTQENQSERQVWETSVGDKWKTSVNSCSPRHPPWETSARDKWETSVNSCGP